MPSRHELQDAIVVQAVHIAKLEAWRDGDAGTIARLTSENVELTRERSALLAENDTVRKLSDLYGAQSLEFCQKYEVEEVRANTYRQERDNARAIVDMLQVELDSQHAATAYDLCTITSLRAEVKKLKSRKLKGSR